MTAQSGDAFLIKVGDGGGSSETFTMLNGQRSGQISFSTDSVDTTTKSNNNWGSSIAGTQAMTVTVGGVRMTSDAALARLDTASKTATPINVKVVINTQGDHWQGAFRITANNLSGNQGEVITYDFTLQNTGEPRFITVSRSNS